MEKGFVKNLGKRIANISIGVSVTKGVGYVGLTLVAASGVDSIYEACKVDGTGNCGKTVMNETVGLFGGAYLGSLAADLAFKGVILALGATASVPVLAILTVGAFVVGGAIGGMIGASLGKDLSDGVYTLYEWVTE